MRAHASIAISVTALAVAVLGSTPIGEAARDQLVPKKSVGPLQLQADAVRSNHVRDGSLLAADFRAGQLPHDPEIVWAVVDRLGSLEAGERAVSSTRVPVQGVIYTVTFDRSMHNCAVLATQRTVNNAYAAARPGGAGVNSVTVSITATTKNGSQATPSGFSVAALCERRVISKVP